MSTKRIYRVITKTGEDQSTERFVRAASASQAKNHVIKDQISVEVAQQDDLIRAGAQGLEIEESDASQLLSSEQTLVN